jgi:hypothetical protein
MYTFEYYAQYFNVDTVHVVERLMHSFVPRVGTNFVRDHVKHRPDLYGVCACV